MMNRSSQKQVALIAATVIAFIVIGARQGALADEFFWDGGGDGASWDDPDNWEGKGVPAETDVAIFDSGATEQHAVYVTEDIASDQLIIRNDHVLLNLGGNTFLLNDRMEVGDAANQDGSLQITNGLLSKSTSTTVGGSSYVRHKLILKGENSGLEIKQTLYVSGTTGRGAEMLVANGAAVTNTLRFYIGYTQLATLVISNARVKASASGTAINNTGHNGEILVTGSDAVFDQSGHFFHTHAGTGTMIIEKGARKIGAAIHYSDNIKSQGLTIVRDPGSLMLVRRLMLGAKTAVIGGEPVLRGDAVLEVVDGGLVETSANKADNNDYFYIGGGSRIFIRDGAIHFQKSGSYRQNPFLFDVGATLAIELTEDTLAHIDAKGPLIWSGAILNDSVNILEGAVLELSLAEDYAPPFNSVFPIFRYEGALQGTFDGLEDGAEFKVGESRFRIDYGAGVDSQITLTALPPAGAIILVR